MAAFDFDRSIKWAKIDRRLSIARRRDDELPFVAAPGAGAGLLLDSCVYIDQFQGRFPGPGMELLKTRVLHHSSIAISELMFAVGRLDPRDSRTADAIANIGSVIKLMQSHRLLDVDADVLGRGAMLGGIMARLQGYRKDDQRRAVNDAVLFLQALKFGLTVFSRNIADFDVLLQLVPSGRVLFYRHEI